MQWNSLQWWSVLVVCTGILFGCKPASPHDFDVIITPNTLYVGAQNLDLKLNPDPKTPELKVVGNMNHAGMQPVTGIAKRQSDGRYVLSKFNFNMAGDWILSISADTEPVQSSDISLTVQ